MAEKSKGRLRHAWDALAHVHLADWLGTLALSALNGAGVGYAAWWAWATQWGYLPVYLAALFAFTLSVWLVNGFIWMRRQRRPSHARIAFDYSYALALEGVEICVEDGNEASTMQIRPQFRNVGNGPVKFFIEKLDTTVEDRIASGHRDFDGVIPRAIVRTIMSGAGFQQDAYDQFHDRTTGVMEYAVKYGHPDDAYSRRVTATVALQIVKRKDGAGKRTASLIWIMQNEADASIL